MKLKNLPFILLFLTSIFSFSQKHTIKLNNGDFDYKIKETFRDYLKKGVDINGLCLVRNFQYDKPFEWIESNCDSLKKEKMKVKSKRDSIKTEQRKLKMMAYQKKLISLGYEVDVNGFPDNKTCIVHDKYLIKKTKDERKAKRKARRKKKKQE